MGKDPEIVARVKSIMDTDPRSGHWYYVYILGDDNKNVLWVGYTIDVERKLYEDLTGYEWAEQATRIKIKHQTQDKAEAKQTVNELRKKYGLRLRRQSKGPTAYFNV